MATRKKNGRRDEELEVLRAIWNEMKALNRRIDTTNQSLDAGRREIESEADGLRKRMVESEVRLATATTGLSGDARELSGLIREWREEHRSDRADLRARLQRLEEHAGLSPSR